jgi:hypothetical protein
VGLENLGAGSITSHYSGTELEHLIEAANKVSAIDTRAPALTILKRREAYYFKGAAGEYVYSGEFNRVTVERDALQQRLNAADQRIDELERDRHRLANCSDVRFGSPPNGDAGDSSVNIEVVGHWMDKPFERVIGENYNENLRTAIDQAMTAPAYPPARPEHPEPQATKDDEWHIYPCKQGHRDVGAAGGIAHCYTCDEKSEAATTQEAFERWNANHPQQ